jgi:hypothetical protein
MVWIGASTWVPKWSWMWTWKIAPLSVCQLRSGSFVISA